MLRSHFVFVLFAPLSVVSGAGCSLGLQFDECSSSAQCRDSEVCLNGACEGGPTGTTGPTDELGCTPGEAEPCVCTDGIVGVRSCQPSGDLGPCECAQASGDSTGSSQEGSTTTTEGSSSTVGDAESSNSTTAGGETDTEECVTVEPSMVVRDQASTPEPGEARFFLTLDDYGLGMATPDEFRIEYWFGEGEGTADLGSTANVQYATCRACIRVIEDAGATTVRRDFFTGTQYLQTEGTLVTADDPHDGEVTVTLEGVRLVEVTFDGVVSEPVAGGQCVAIVDGTYSTPVAPEGWTCASEAFSDIVCSCGCGVQDGACQENVISDCESCDEVGACNEAGAGCPGGLDQTDPTLCSPTVPPGWTCAAEALNDDACHCGCGEQDPECVDATASSCEVCDSSGSCEAGPGCGSIDPTDNSTCSDG